MSYNERKSNHHQQNQTQKLLIKILILIGIGIPILIELITAFELFNTQVLKKQDRSIKYKSQQTKKIRSICPEDILIQEAETTLILKNARIIYGYSSWGFELNLEVERYPESGFQIDLYKLKLKNGEIIETLKSEKWIPNPNKKGKFLRFKWSIPAGSIPVAISLLLKVPPDNPKITINKEIHLGKIPVLYDSSEKNK